MINDKFIMRSYLSDLMELTMIMHSRSSPTASSVLAP